MALKDLVLKAKEPMTATAMGSEFKFGELSDTEEQAARALAEKEHKEKYKESTKEEVENYVGKYLTYMRLHRGGEELSKDEFFALPGIYINEIMMAVQLALREKHPTYFKALKEFQKEQASVLEDIVREAMGKKKE